MALSLTMFCAGCDDGLKTLARNVPGMPKTCTVPSPPPDLANGTTYKRVAFAYAAAFRAVNREKVECGQFADKVLSDIRTGRK